MARTAAAELPTVSFKRERKRVEIDNALDQILAKRGVVNEQAIVEEASDETHPLHKYFEWDDSTAAHSWRLSQATALILASKMAPIYKQQAATKIVVQSEPTQVRRLVNAFRGEGFKLRGDVLANVDERQALVEKKLAILRGWCREASDIEELQPVRQAILVHLAGFEKA